MSTIIGKFASRTAAEQAAAVLVRRGYPAHLISINHRADLNTKLRLRQTRTYWLESTGLCSRSVLGALLGAALLGGLAAFYFSIGYLHWLLLVAVTCVGAYVGGLLGTMWFKSVPLHRAATGHVLLIVQTSAYNSQSLNQELRYAGAIAVEGTS